MPLTIAVTGPTGDLGRSLLRSLERSREVGRIVGMARRPFDPAALGLRRTEYVRGDVTNGADVAALVARADVVVHLAFVIVAGSGHSEEVNVAGSRTVFEAVAAAAARRLVYASSVAAYGFHADNPSPLTEDVPPRGSEAHPYSRHKAAVERVLHEVIDPTPVEAYVFRPCVVAGPDAPKLLDALPYVRAGRRLPAGVRRALGAVPGLRPVLPDPGIPFQLVHHDDVATALRAAVLGRGPAGTYNLAAPGVVTVADLAAALGWRRVPVPRATVDAAAAVVARLPTLPDEARWLEAARVGVLMDAGRARRELGWRPRHDALQTLRATVSAAR